jgi:protoheme IX farnesyltransferase
MMKVIDAEVSPLAPFAPLTREPAAGDSAVALAPAEAPSKLADYLELSKPRIAVMALFTVAVGYLLGAKAATNFAVLFHTLFGAGLVAAGGSALNQWLERRIDARMWRTMRRPLPAGRVSPAEAFLFGVGLGFAGLAYLLATVPYPAAVAAAVTFVSYVLVYTPLKRVTVWNTVVGAVPGALPPVIGWCAARGWDGMPAAMGLFLVIFLWQLPHFLAIAWLYRDDYERGGIRVLPVVDREGLLTGRQAVLHSLALLVVSLAPIAAGLGGTAYLVGALLLGVGLTLAALRLARARDLAAARRLFLASVVYLPALTSLLLLASL